MLLWIFLINYGTKRLIFVKVIISKFYISIIKNSRNNFFTSEIVFDDTLEFFLALTHFFGPSFIIILKKSNCNRNIHFQYQFLVNVRIELL